MPPWPGRICEPGPRLRCTPTTARIRGEAKRVLCDEEGADPDRVVLGHSGDSGDSGAVDHLSELAGFLLGMDRFGANVDTTFEARAEPVVEMRRRGLPTRWCCCKTPPATSTASTRQ
ncbi:hypothetical protein [Streptomyces sp. NPDC047939]|uniref:phosphotriesterase family protein n=1 Tax=Streptomyces sp. NPDC047939 TaxID=3155381 RepID=UPI00343D3F2A